MGGEGFLGFDVGDGLAEDDVDEVNHAIGVGEGGGRGDEFVGVAEFGLAEKAERGEGEAGLGAEELGAVVVGVGLVGGPGGFEEDGAAAFEFDEGDGEVIDIEGGFGVDFAFAPGAGAEAAGAELGVGLTGDGGGVEFAHEVEAAVEGVHADVVAAAAAGVLALGEPGADAGDALAAGPGGFGVIDIAEDAVVEEGFGGLDVGAEAAVLSDHEGDLAAFGLGDEFGGVGGAGGHGFVEHDVLAGFQGFESDLGVEVVREGDGDDVDVGAGEQDLVVGDEFGDVELVGGFAAAFGRDLGEGDDAGLGVLLKAADVVEADGSGADDGDVEETVGFFGFGHGRRGGG